jgi:hypothetical protein
MNATKLTLTMDKELIEKAKAHAAEQNISLSGLVSNYLQATTKNTNQTFDKNRLSPITRKAVGLLASSNLGKRSYKDLLVGALEEKYGL